MIERSDRHQTGDQVLEPRLCSNDALTRHLAGVRVQIRRMINRYGVANGHICTMARQAGQKIPDGAQRAEFLRLLIDLHEFGREAKHRDLLSPDKTDAAPLPVDSVEPTGDGQSAQNAASPIAARASERFFSSLDE